MRKLYSLLSGTILTLLAFTAHALPTPDVAGFTITVDAPNINVNFTNTSVLGSEPGIRKAYWYFGDGTSAQTGPLQGIQHHYASAGTYSACLRIYRYLTNSNDSVLSAQICQIFIINSVCAANFEFRDSLLLNTSPMQHLVKFWALPFHNAQKPVVRVCWNFGDGSPDTCITNTAGTPTPNLLNITHTYLQQGPYNVCVRITYQDGCIAEKCKPVTLLNPPPPPPADSCTAAFERIGLTATSNPLQATFRALPWHNNNKLPARICWTFGDGRDTCIQYANTYTGPYTVNHTYTAPGLYPVCVNILYQGGCQSQRCESVLIGRPDSCGADFERMTVNTTPNPLSVLLKALPQHNNNKKPQRICWNFGDGTPDTCIDYLNIYTGLYTIAHTYQQPGNYNVCVSITYFGGCQAYKCKPVTIVRPDSCGADFNQLAVTPGNNPLFAYFQALPSHNNNKKPSRICWTFGDGRDTCINYTEAYTGLYGVGHQYTQPGNYQVCVTITYFGGCQATKCKPITVQVPDSCRAGFELLPATSATPLNIGVHALPWHSNNKKPVRICWNFGDGTPDTCVNYPVTYTGAYTMTHHYQQPGPYNVCVTIRYDGGCESHYCRTVQVPPPPVTCTAGILEIAPSLNSLVRSFVAVPGSNPPVRPERVCWIFGDGRDTCIMLDPTQPTPNLNITHTYPGPGTYQACVEIRYQGGCLARSCREVVIRSNPDICGGYMTDSITGPRTYRFRGFSIHAPNDNPVGFHWNFGDGTSAAGPDVTHTFTQGGPFNVCLVINTQLGCETRICRNIAVPGTNVPALVITPNPVVNTLTALFRSNFTETVTIRILNSSGTPVRIYSRSAVAGANTWSFDVSTLLPGIYSLVVQSPNQLASVVFVKQ